MATTTPTRPAPGTPPRRRRTSVLVVLAVLGVLAVLSAFGAAFRTAPSDGPPGTPPPTVDSVGRIDGSTALIALLARGDRISAYVCDGNAALGERFSGTLVGNRAALRSADGAQLTVDLTAGGATGTFTPAGATAAQTFRTSPSTGTAGWYSAEAANGAATASWVVLADGTQTGVSTGGEDRPKHRRKHRAPHLQLRPSGVSPTAAGTTAQPDDGSESPAGEGGPVRETLDVPSPDDGSGSLLDEGVQCVKLVNGVCAVRGSIDPVELDGGTTAQPSRVDGPLPILSADPQRGLAGN